MTEADDRTDFFAAVTGGDLERAKGMLAADPALVDARDAHGRSAILTAVYHRQREMANLIVARGATLDLFEAAAAGEVERVERLVAGAPESVNAFSADGWTPLHLAAFFGRGKVAELLLEHGADVAARSRNANGNTPLHAALAGNQAFVAGLLIGSGADVDAADANGWRPLHMATANNNLDAMNTLIAQGADLEARNGAGATALAIAEEKNLREAAAMLRRYGPAR
ncbi:MAG: ankyrin repeat domain-containing protein [Betaproteobacteria bacterium]